MRFLIIILISGCSVETPEQQPIKLTLVSNTAEIRQKCGNTPLEPFGCAIQNKSSINPGGSCEIVAIKPRAFDDHDAIKTLGHELWHCFSGPVHK